MIRIEAHLENQEKIIRLLKEAGGRRPRFIVRQAVNETAKNARKKIWKGIRKNYTLHGVPMSTMELKRATSSQLWAEIFVSGRQLSLVTYYKHRKNGKRTAAKAAQKRGPLKPIQMGKMKGFVATMPKTGHVGIFQRVPGTYMKGHKRRPYKNNSAKITRGREQIRESLGSSVSKLAEVTYRSIRSETQRDLETALWRFIDEAFK